MTRKRARLERQVDAEVALLELRQALYAARDEVFERVGGHTGLAACELCRVERLIAAVLRLGDFVRDSRR